MNKQELLNSISPDMKLTRDFFKKVYGYSLYDKEFADKAIRQLEEVGVGKARYYLDTFTTEYESQQDQVMKAVAVWHTNQLHNRKEAKQWQQKKTKRLTKKEVSTQILGLSMK